MNAFFTKEPPPLGTKRGAQWTLHNNLQNACDIHRSSARDVLSFSFTDEEADALRSGIIFSGLTVNESQDLCSSEGHAQCEVQPVPPLCNIVL